MWTTKLPLETRLAANEQDLLGAQRLRYRVFVEELGGDGALVDHRGRFERDRFDPFFEHLVLVDPARDPATFEHVIGVYRLLPEDRASAAGGFRCENQFDLDPLRRTGRPLLELGRSCVAAEHRGGTAMVQLWTALADYVRARGSEILFGAASFHGSDPSRHAEPLSMLHHRHLAPPDLRVRSRSQRPMDLIPEAAIDRGSAMARVPALIKAYLRLGGVVGDGACVDAAFNTTDVCLVLDTARLAARPLSRYASDA